MEEKITKLIIESLSPIERNTLPEISEGWKDINEVSKEATTDNTTTIRAIGFLKNKKLVETKTEEKNVVNLGILGINYLKKELPERILLNKLFDKKFEQFLILMLRFLIIFD